MKRQVDPMEETARIRIARAARWKMRFENSNYWNSQKTVKLLIMEKLKKG